MVSSLAAQLAQSASLNSALLNEKSRRKPTESYLFTGREADKYDLETVHALAVNAFLQLSQLNLSFRRFEKPLFSEAAKSVDRTLQTKEENAKLDDAITIFLQLLGPYVMEAPTGKVIEWLVRRFRIHEFNVEAILCLFLPYHESPHFAKVVTILHIQPNSTWSFLLAHKAAAKNVPRPSLVTEMLKNSSVARFVATLLPNALKGGYNHRCLTAFHVATLHDFIVRSDNIDEGTIAYLLPSFLEPLQISHSSGQDEILGSYLLLAALSQKCHLSPEALTAIVVAMAKRAEQVRVNQFLRAMTAICEPQDEVEAFPKSVVRCVLGISRNAFQDVEAALLLVGVEKFINPLLPGLCQRLTDEQAMALLELICTSSNTPSPVLYSLATSLFHYLISPSNDPQQARKLLSILYQRHPSIVKNSAHALSSADPAAKSSIDQLILSVSTVTSGGAIIESSHNDLVVAASSFDATVRLNAVQQLLAVIAEREEIEPSERDSIHSALLVRLLDSETEVVETLYSRPSIITPIILENHDTYISYLSTALCSPEAKPKRSVVRAHLAFAANHLCVAGKDVEVTEKTFHGIFFPFMMYSKPKQHTADAVWEIIEKDNSEASSSEEWRISRCEWLAGCVDVWQFEKSKDEGGQAEKMAAINLALAAKISETIMISNKFTEHLKTLLSHLRNDNPHVRVFGYLLARSLLGRLSGEHQLNAATEVIQAMDLEHPMDNVWYGVDDPKESISDASLGRSIVAKPSSQNTLRLLQISILALLAIVQRPSNAVLNWFDVSPSSTSDGRASQFVHHMRTVYRVANLSIPVVFTVHILSLLFTNLGEESLAFLASIWISNEPASDKTSQLRIAALRHAAAFLDAHQQSEHTVDFQTIVPALLVAVQSSDMHVRQAAADCIATLSSLVQRPFSSVYAFDWIYGTETDQLQYLDQADFKKYIEALTGDHEHIIRDEGHIRTFHKQHLGTSTKKKHTEYRRRVLCFLLSHVVCLSSMNARISLLRAVEGVSDKVKIQILLPYVNMIQDTDQSLLRTRFGSDAEEFTTLIISSVDPSICSDLNEPSSLLWSTFTSLLRQFFSADSMASPRSALVHSLERGLFAGLDLRRQLSTSEILLEMGTQSQQTYATVKNLLMNISLEIPLLIQILTRLLPSQQAPATAPPPSKRVKTTEPGRDTLPSFSLLAEILGSKDLPGSIDLITRLLEALNRVLQLAPSTQNDLSYIQQLLMLAIENVADKVIEAPNAVPSSIRLDVLVEVVRVARNPQTFHQALLLIANLTRLAPDSVLHNVMPVFTFMGSNVFHRDDVYSFRVVQKTIDNIVPVMVSSLRRTHEGGIDLYISAKDFLRVFTDASSHIPRHRRTNFFVHLIDVLGVDIFFPPVCILLLAKAVGRSNRTQTDDGLFALPNSVLHHYESSLQVATLIEVLKESQRLMELYTQHSDASPALLAEPSDDDNMVLLSRAQTLVSFVGQAIKPLPSDSTSKKPPVAELVHLLIALATLQDSSGLTLEGIRTAARTSLSQVLAVIPAVNFLASVLAMLESAEPKIQNGALELLVERLGQVSDIVRTESSATCIQIIIHIQSILSLNVRGSALASSCFGALRVIASSACAGEEPALTSIIPLIILAIRSRTLADSSISVLPPLIPKLGPRIIPFFREIVTEIVSLSRSEGILQSSIDALRSLLTTIPTFWSNNELTQVVDLYVGLCGSERASPMAGLIKSLAKRVPSKVLLAALNDFWSSKSDSHSKWPEEAVVGFFDILKRSLRAADKSAVAEHLRVLFKLFLGAFESVKNNDAEPTKAENGVISAFLGLVVKLNDTAFRPLFRKLYDWAFTDIADTSRKITFLHNYGALLDYFKSLMTPYMSFLLAPLLASLQSYNAHTTDDVDYWVCIVKTLTKTFIMDEGVYWRDDKIRQIAKPLVDQVAICISLDSSMAKDCYPECLVALGDCTSDDTLLKSINLDVLMQTRSEDPKLRIFALNCSEHFWRNIGGKLLGFVAETTTFIAECAEDEHDMVVDAARSLKDAVESVAGKIDV